MFPCLSCFESLPLTCQQKMGKYLYLSGYGLTCTYKVLSFDHNYGMGLIYNYVEWPTFVVEEYLFRHEPFDVFFNNSKTEMYIRYLNMLPVFVHLQNGGRWTISSRHIKTSKKDSCHIKIAKFAKYFRFNIDSFHDI